MMLAKLVPLTTRSVRRVAGREGWALADQVLVSGSNFVTNILLARSLGVKEFGIFTLAWMAVLFVNSLQMAAVLSPMMSIGPKQRKEIAATYYGSVLVAQLGFAALAMLLVWAGIYVASLAYPQQNLAGLRFPLAFAAFGFQLQEFFRRYFFTCVRPVAAVTNDLISYGGQIALLALAFAQKRADSSTALLIIGGTSIGAVGVGVLQTTRLKWGGYSQFCEVGRRHWRISKWLIGSALLQWTSGNFFVVTGAVILGPIVAGVIRVAENIMGVTHVLFLGLDNAVPRHAAELLQQRGTRPMLEYLRKVRVFSTGITALFALIVAASPSLWLQVTYGSQYGSYSYVLRWYALVYVVISLRISVSAALRALETAMPIFLSYLLASLFSISIARLLVLQFGLAGVLGGVLGTHIILQMALELGLRYNIRLPEKCASLG